MNLTENLTDNGTTATLSWDGGVGYYAAQGSFGSGTVKLEYSFDGGSNYLTTESAGWLSSAGSKQFSLPVCQLRLSLTGATSPDLNLYIR